MSSQYAEDRNKALEKKYHKAKGTVLYLNRIDFLCRIFLIIPALILSFLTIWTRFFIFVFSIIVPGFGQEGVLLDDLIPRYLTILYLIIIAGIIWGFFYSLIKVIFWFRIAGKEAFIYEYESALFKKNAFDNSLLMSYTYLDQYYAQIRKQSHKGFILTCIVTTIGAFLIFGSIICMYFNKYEPAYVTVSGGVVTELISAVMFYFHNKSIQSMSNYHDKLFLAQNVAMAIKLSDSISEEKREDLKVQIAKELVSDINSNIAGLGSKIMHSDSEQKQKA